MPSSMVSPFAQRLGLFSASVVVVSGIIGGGIFINPYLVAQLLHTHGLILAAWGAGGLLAMCGAFVFAELSTVMPRVGGQYAFFREAFGPLFGFLHGWTLLLVISSGAVAAIAVALADYVIRFTHWPPAVGLPLAVGLLLALSGYHALGMRPGAVLLNLVTTSKVLVLVALIVAGLLVSCNREDLKKSGIGLEGSGGEAPHRIKDLVGGLGPSKWLRMLIVIIDEGGDRGL